MKEHAVLWKWWLAGAVGLAVSWGTGAAGIEVATDWAYHGAGDAGRFSQVPGTGETWLAGGSERVGDGEDVVLWVMTDHDFGGEAEEQVFVRWWDGYMAHWIMGVWEKNLRVGRRAFRKESGGEEVVTDLWKIVVPAWVTQPGENFYAIQLKASKGEEDWEAKYLLREESGDFSRKNGLGQVYSSSEEFDGADWRVVVVPGGTKE